MVSFALSAGSEYLVNGRSSFCCKSIYMNDNANESGTTSFPLGKPFLCALTWIGTPCGTAQ